MISELPHILRWIKGSTRKRRMVAVLHVLAWPVYLFSLPFIARRTPTPSPLYPAERGSSSTGLSGSAEPAPLPSPWIQGEEARNLKILLIRVDGIGDLAMSRAIFPSLREHFPGAQIDLLTSDVAGPLGRMFVAAGWIDHVQVLPLLGRGPRFFLSLYRTLKPLRYDVTIDLRGDSRNVMLMALLNAPRRIGLFGAGLSYLLTDALIVPEPHHQSAEPAAMVEALGVTIANPAPTLPVPAAEQSFADQWLADHGMIFGRPIVALHLTAFQPSKVWPLERFVEAARQLRERCGAQFVIVGGKSDLPVAQQCAAALSEAVAIAAGDLSLENSAAVLSRCALLIGNDSGPGHLAGAVGCPAIIIFGNGDPRRFGVVGSRVVNLRTDRPCDPRCDKLCATPQRFCMLEVSVEQVTAAAERLLAQWATRKGFIQ